MGLLGVIHPSSSFFESIHSHDEHQQGLVPFLSLSLSLSRPFCAPKIKFIQKSFLSSHFEEKMGGGTNYLLRLMQQQHTPTNKSRPSTKTIIDCQQICTLICMCPHEAHSGWTLRAAGLAIPCRRSKIIFCSSTQISSPSMFSVIHIPRLIGQDRGEGEAQLLRGNIISMPNAPSPFRLWQFRSSPTVANPDPSPSQSAPVRVAQQRSSVTPPPEANQTSTGNFPPNALLPLPSPDFFLSFFYYGVSCDICECNT